MSRLARWSIVAVGTVLSFALGLWLFHFARWSWLPDGEADRWVVAAAFGTVVAAVATAGLAWWASREPSDGGDSARVTQSARASGHSRITMIGNQYNSRRDADG